MYDAKIVADSRSPSGARLTTFEVTLPRIVLAEFNTHRALSRNSASSRAIPVAKSIQQVIDDPFIPETFARNQPGMQGDSALEDSESARAVWVKACDDAVCHAQELERLGLHKALANRILEPFKWQTIIVSATEWDNFFALRTDANAQAEIRKPAQMMLNLYENHEPMEIKSEWWHLPLLSVYEYADAIDGNWNFWKKVSVARCARVSYLTHDGKRSFHKDVELHDSLLENGHLSPFEHVATPTRVSMPPSNFVGWRQYRKEIAYEDNYLLMSASREGSE